MAFDIRGMVPLLQVFDMPTAIKFYCDVLGFEIAQDDGRPAPERNWAWLKRGNVELMLNTAYDADQRPSVPDRTRFDAHQDTGFFFACPDVDEAYAYLQGAGANAKRPHVAPYGMKQLYVRDPDGYELCFQWPVNQ